MSNEDFEQDNERTTRSTRRAAPQTERLGARDSGYGEPVRQNWRSSRSTLRNRRQPSLPSSRQELVIWLQHGGWWIVAVASVVVFFLIVAIILTRPRPLPADQTTLAPTSLTGSQPFPIQSSPTPGQNLPTVAQPATSGAQFRVINTEGLGLLLRPEPNRSSKEIKTLPDGSLVTIIGEDFVGPEYTWKHIRDAEGAEGWVAADFLQPAQ